MFSFLPNSRVIGIDISTYDVTVAYLGSFGAPKIKGVGSVSLERNPWTKNGIRDKEVISRAITKAMEEAQPNPITTKQAVCSIPESIIFTKVIKLPKLSRRELNQTIPYEAADALPLPLEEVYLDWQIDEVQAEGEDKNTLHVLVVAAPKKFVDDLNDIAANTGLQLLSVESQSFAVVRSVCHLLDKKAVSVVVTIDNEVTTIALANAMKMKMTSTIQIGRRQLVKDRKTATARIAEEINESIKYYNNRLGERAEVKSILLTGIGAATKDLNTDIEELAKVPTFIGYPDLKLPNGLVIHPRFNTVIGLGLWREGRGGI